MRTLGRSRANRSRPEPNVRVQLPPAASPQTIGSATISRAMLGIRMPRPSRATSHHPAQNAPTAIRTPSRASAFVLRRISPLPRVRAKVRSQSDLPTLVIVHLKPVVC